MSDNDPNIVQQLSTDWGKMREPAEQQLIQTRALLEKLRAARGDNPPSEEENNLEALVNQLTSICQQINAQFTVVQSATEDRDRALQQNNLEGLINKIMGWRTFLKFGQIKSIDFYRQWLQTMGVPSNNKDPAVLANLGMLPKNLAACKAWESALLLPRRVSAIMEVGSGFGLNALCLARMVRMGVVERQHPVSTLAKKLESVGPCYGKQPLIGMSECNFQPQTITTIPIDAFDAIWFHSQVWDQWIKQDGPQLLSALGELSRRAQFLLLSTTEDDIPRRDLLDPLYLVQCVAEHNDGMQTIKFFVAQRRFATIAGKFFPCTDMRIHDPTWQGSETLAHDALILPWNRSVSHLQTRRLLLGKGEVVRTFLKRTPHLNIQRVHHREIEVWPSVSGLIPELPTITGHSEDDIGCHLLLKLNVSVAHLPILPLNKPQQFILLRSAIRVLHALRQKNLHLNFLRVGNFIFTGDYASFLSAEFISYEELEDPLDALLWFLRDLTKDILYWHDWPIEPAHAQMIGSLPEEYRGLATLMLRSRTIDDFLNDPRVKSQFLNS